MTTQNNQRSRRRTNAVSGFVNFPVNNPDLPSDRQGGMFVRLVVHDTKREANFYDKWACCCGGTQSFIYDECYIGDDHSILGVEETKKLEKLEKEDPLEFGYMLQTFETDFRNEGFHFPWFHLSEEETTNKHASREYLCILTIGSTGWSNVDWTCTYEDLTEKGKMLYKLLQELYPGCDLYLQTWLDT